jgi:type II secretory pathway component PulJ
MFKLSKGFTLIELFVILAITAIILLFLGIYKLVSRSDYTGTVENIQNLTQTMPNMSNTGPQFSFSIRLNTGTEIITFSSEDRQFGIIKQGDKIQVATFKYAPWNIGKAGTLYGGRVLKIYTSSASQ